MYLTYKLFVYMITIALIDGARWYPAMTTQKVTQNEPQMYSNTTASRSENNFKKYNWRIRNPSNQKIIENQVDVRAKLNSLTNILVHNASEVPQIKYEVGDTKINISNVLNNNKKNETPERRIIRKRCPILETRQIAQSVANKSTISRFLEIFEVVEFEHVICTSSSGLEGKCLHEYECQSAGGSPMGVCGDGYGSCCVVTRSCYGQSSAPVSWFTNPEYPSPNTDRLSCGLTINKTSQDIKQIRLDIAHFELLPPTAGTCEQDQFVVTGQNINNVIPILCGINTGQHFYIEVGDTEGPIHLTIKTIAAEGRLFAIKVTQLTKSDVLAAPTGCLKYFSAAHGYIESFNYRNITDISNARYPSYFNNLNYAICIERDKSSCSVTYTNEDPMQIVNYDTDGLLLIPPRQAGVETFNCPSDWLLISAVRLCGERLNDGSVVQDFNLDAPVTDISAGPIAIWFRSDEGYVGRGFKLHYQQNICAIPA